MPSPGDRVDILRAITRHGTRPRLAIDVDFDALAHSEECEFFTGADMSALVTEASNAAFKEHILVTSRRGKRKTDSPCNLDIKVSAKHFKVAFSKVRPSVSLKDRKKYEQMKRTYSSVKISSDSKKEEAKTTSEDEDDDMSEDRIKSEDRGSSCPEQLFVDNANEEDEHVNKNEFDEKDLMESNHLQTYQNEAEEGMGRLEEAGVQVECVSSPNESTMPTSADLAKFQPSATPSPRGEARATESPEVLGDLTD